MGRSHEPGRGLDHTEPLFGTGKVRYELRRVPPAAVLNCTMISASVHGILGHWNGHATRPHEKENCEACAAAVPFKWNGYFFATSRREKIVFIVQIPPGPYPSFREYESENGSLAGCRVSLWRAKRCASGSVSVNILPPDLSGWLLPKVPDIRGPLDRIFWGGYRNASYMKDSGDTSPVQTQFTDELPGGVVEVELSNGKKTNKKNQPATPEVPGVPINPRLDADIREVFSKFNGKKR